MQLGEKSRARQSAQQGEDCIHAPLAGGRPGGAGAVPGQSPPDAEDHRGQPRGQDAGRQGQGAPHTDHLEPKEAHSGQGRRQNHEPGDVRVQHQVRSGHPMGVGGADALDDEPEGDTREKSQPNLCHWISSSCATFPKISRAVSMATAKMTTPK